MITNRDITVRVLAESAELESIQVGDVASGDAVMVAPQQDLDEALRLMAHHQLRRLPVADGDRLVGILAQADVAHEEDSERVGEMVEEMRRRRSPTSCSSATTRQRGVSATNTAGRISARPLRRVPTPPRRLAAQRADGGDGGRAPSGRRLPEADELLKQTRRRRSRSRTCSASRFAAV